MVRFFSVIAAVLLVGIVTGTQAEEITKEQIKGLDEQVQDIKKDVLAISTELNLLEEKLLYPSNTQVSLFVSLTTDSGFRLDAVEIQLDGKPVAHHIYSFKELEALRSGGIQRIYTGNIRTGEHELTVAYLGQTSLGNDYRKTQSYRFKKGVGPGMVEISLAGTGGIEFKDW